MGITFTPPRLRMDPMDKHERLQFARQQAGFPTASDAARALGVSVPTYSAHENGSRSFKEDKARKYARRFGVDVLWLIYGKGEPKPTANTEIIERDYSLLPNEINFEIFQKARRVAREIELTITNGGVSDYDSYKKLLTLTYLDMLEREKVNAKATEDIE
ncbi:putative helix-turn-helix domain-containing protein [Roseibium sp. TrichSKD4]|uniref:helix-turn-helix domain-containing protein n=1 Tax=Roseibium sp. TrichSKD4 TaxID=744980 RepID=UPI0001E572D1|nr:helix-turn-helix transcriptional regulator [Roseibium sp. TrichSKD4]EFO29121.1 putative helix-turn-helix domain-containing protein [Roseibium sp. TrichSKD4]